MAASAPWLRIVGLVLILAGVVRATVGNVLGEGVNDSGQAPSAWAGFVIIAIGSFALYSAYLIRTGQFRSLALPITLGLVVAGGVGTMLADQARPSEYLHGLRGPVGFVVVAGVGVCYVTVILTLGYAIVAAGAYLVSWLLNVLPPLRRRGVGASIRHTWRSPLKDSS